MNGSHPSSAREALPLAHHFDTMDQQYQSAKLGMWIFLVTEVLLFSGLFLIYAVYRALHPEVFDRASRMLDLRLGGLNTVVLITSSLTMALAVHAAQTGAAARRQVRYLLLTVALGFLFLVVKYFEYAHKFHAGLLPGVLFQPRDLPFAPETLPNARRFFAIYFLMTGLHGLHVVAGLGAILWVAWGAARRRFSATYYTPVELTGLYWHLVDMIWIYLFPLLYLIDRA